jgi:small conductance mechanosensitive channel
MRIFHALLFFLGAFLLDRMWRGLLRKIKVATLKRDPTHDADLERRLDTLGLMARRMGSVTLYVAAFLMTLADFDVQVGPLVAGLGIVGVAVGFGAQFLVRDLINGFFLVAEDQFRVGDSVKLDEFPGTVETITLRTTSLRALGGELHILPNGEIRCVTNFSRHWSRAVVDVTVARTADLEAAFAALLAGAQSAHRDEAVRGSFLEAPEIVGVTEISDTAVKIRLWAKVLPGQQWEVERAIRRAAADALSARGVALPVQRSEVALDRDSLSTLRDRGEGP